VNPKYVYTVDETDANEKLTYRVCPVVEKSGRWELSAGDVCSSVVPRRCTDNSGENSCYQKKNPTWSHSGSPAPTTLKADYVVKTGVNTIKYRPSEQGAYCKLARDNENEIVEPKVCLLNGVASDSCTLEGTSTCVMNVEKSITSTLTLTGPGTIYTEFLDLPDDGSYLKITDDEDQEVKLMGWYSTCFGSANRQDTVLQDDRCHDVLTGKILPPAPINIPVGDHTLTFVTNGGDGQMHDGFKLYYLIDDFY
jgi:hypothetical protein